jgi:hypothetical protein
MHYVIFDDALRGSSRGWTADLFADTLRAPLAAVGVSVTRRHGEGHGSCRCGFQAPRSCAPESYETKLDQIEEIVDGILKRGPVRFGAVPKAEASDGSPHE